MTVLITELSWVTVKKFPCKIHHYSKVLETFIMSSTAWETVGPRLTCNKHKEGFYCWRIKRTWSLFHKDEFYSLRDKAQDWSLNNSQDLGGNSGWLLIELQRTTILFDCFESSIPDDQAASLH